MTRFIQFEDGDYYNLDEISKFKIQPDEGVDTLTGAALSEANAPIQPGRYFVIATMKQTPGERTQELVAKVFPSQESAEHFLRHLSD